MNDAKEWFWYCNNCGCEEFDCTCQEPDFVHVWRDASGPSP